MHKQIIYHVFTTMFNSQLGSYIFQVLPYLELASLPGIDTRYKRLAPFRISSKRQPTWNKKIAHIRCGSGIQTHDLSFDSPTSTSLV